MKPSRWYSRCFVTDRFIQVLDQGLVHPGPAIQAVAVRVDHGATQPMQPGPGCFVTAQAKHALQAQRTGPVLLGRHPPHGPKPHGERDARVVEDSPHRHCGLVGTASALVGTGTHRLCLGTRAARTAETVPAQGEKIVLARFFGRKARLQFGHSPRIVFHRSAEDVRPKMDYVRCGHRKGNIQQVCRLVSRLRLPGDIVAFQIARALCIKWGCPGIWPNKQSIEGDCRPLMMRVHSCAKRNEHEICTQCDGHW